MLDKRTTNVISLAKQLHEKYRAKGKKVYFSFVDVEKAFDRGPREVIHWAVHKLGVDEWLVSVGGLSYCYKNSQIRLECLGIRL